MGIYFDLDEREREREGDEREWQKVNVIGSLVLIGFQRCGKSPDLSKLFDVYAVLGRFGPNPVILYWA